MNKILAALAGVGMLIAGASAQADIIDAGRDANGNGTLSITGSCDTFDCNGVEKVYTSLGPMFLSFEVDEPGTYYIHETITNNTGIAWTDFHWHLTYEIDSDFGTPDIISPFTNVMVTDTSIWIDGGILAPGQSFTATLLINANNSSFNDYWYIEQYPTTFDVPEPAGLAVLGIGLAGLALVRRRRKA